MSYNNDGGCSGGWNMPFVMPFPGTQGNGWGNNNDMFGMLMMLLFFSLFGFGGNGYGARGGMPLPIGGMMPCCGNAGGNVAAEAAAYVGAQNTADKISGIATGIDAIAGIATANGVKIETAKDANAAAFANLNTHLCEAFNNIAMQFNTQTMQGMNMHNSTIALLNDMRAENAKCCCENKSLVQALASQQQYQAATDKSEILRAIADSEARITARMDAAERAAMQEKINALQEQKTALAAQLERQNQTNQLLSAIQAQCGQPRGCAPAPTCSPCAPYNRGCEDPVCTLVNSLVTRWANAQEIPAVPAAA